VKGPPRSGGPLTYSVPTGGTFRALVSRRPAGRLATQGIPATLTAAVEADPLGSAPRVWLAVLVRVAVVRAVTRNHTATEDVLVAVAVALGVRAEHEAAQTLRARPCLTGVPRAVFRRTPVSRRERRRSHARQDRGGPGDRRSSADPLEHLPTGDSILNLKLVAHILIHLPSTSSFTISGESIPHPYQRVHRPGAVFFPRSTRAGLEGPYGQGTGPAQYPEASLPPSTSLDVRKIRTTAHEERRQSA